MSGPLEPVGLRFRGHERALPILAIAIAFRRSLERTVTTLEILIQGPPELRALPPPRHDNTSVPALPLLGEGVGGGERSERSETVNVNDEEENLPNVQRSERDRRAREHPPDLARRLACELGDEGNLAAIRKLTRTYPEDLLHEALRRTLAVPADRVRGSRGAIFTGIIRKLSRESPPAPNP